MNSEMMNTIGFYALILPMGLIFWLAFLALATIAGMQVIDWLKEAKR